ncbi:MAG: type II toxin-antitoxin system MqsR family toxin [Dechloromonas sp.]|nr:type II toxin-antitoxin system MqsR family toxin [Dechloromonas sp.]
MVTFKNLSAYLGDPPKDGASRKVTGGPLYKLAEIQALAATPDAVKLWTEKCRRDVANLTLDAADVGALLQELTERDYRDSEWCDNGKGAWAACDAYNLRRSEYVETAGKTYRIEYFFNFALSKTGKLVLMVSCHT